MTPSPMIARTANAPIAAPTIAPVDTPFFFFDVRPFEEPDEPLDETDDELDGAELVVDVDICEYDVLDVVLVEEELEAGTSAKN